MKQTLGQKLVGISFNPSSMPSVDEAKKKSAELIDIVHANMLESTSKEAMMIHDEVILRIMDTQMWVVKAITWKD